MPVIRGADTVETRCRVLLALAGKADNLALGGQMARCKGMQFPVPAPIRRSNNRRYFNTIGKDVLVLIADLHGRGVIAPPVDDNQLSTG